MTKSGRWRSYNDLAWTELILSPPGENEEEVEALCRALAVKGGAGPKTLLHLGCGAGVYDRVFKRHFRVTGVDISEGMLRIARRLNKDVRYVRGDMREVRLATAFDAVAIPDSIDYMATVRDLGKAVDTAFRHLKPGGVCLIVAHLREQFRENNFVYEGRGRGVRVTVFENNTLTGRNGYEATLVYLIRRGKSLEIFSERHFLGVFDAATWNRLLRRRGFDVQRRKGGNEYERFMLKEGDYPQVVFICRRAKDRRPSSARTGAAPGRSPKIRGETPAED
jgi:SAM-dependent methyltransferase